MGKKWKALVFASGSVLLGMHLYNRFVAKAATQKNKLPDSQGQYFDWKYGQIYYTKKGSGSPILLVHDIDPMASSMEWCKISHRLAKDHTVYTLDLLGCGRSDKPGLDYNNYLYVQMISSFIKDVIKEKTDVVASNLSTSFIFAANNLDKNLFDHIICINPTPIKELDLMPTSISKIKKFFFNTPIIGTFMYNVLSNPLHVDRIFKDFYFSKSQLASMDLKETYYEAAHLKESRGKHLLASIYGNYLHVNLGHCLKNIDKPVCIIGSREIENNRMSLEKYEKANKKFDVTMLSGAKNYPQLEIPEKTLRVIENFLKEEMY